MIKRMILLSFTWKSSQMKWTNKLAVSAFLASLANGYILVRILTHTRWLMVLHATMVPDFFASPRRDNLRTQESGQSWMLTLVFKLQAKTMIQELAVSVWFGLEPPMAKWSIIMRWMRRLNSKRQPCAWIGMKEMSIREKTWKLSVKKSMKLARMSLSSSNTAFGSKTNLVLPSNSKIRFGPTLAECAKSEISPIYLKYYLLSLSYLFSNYSIHKWSTKHLQNYARHIKLQLLVNNSLLNFQYQWVQ